jgi:predicted GNAT family N-acyltransferase
MFSILKFSTSDKENSRIIFSIRQRVFVEEQNVSPEEEYDEFEDTSMHYLLLVEERPAGTARWRFTDKGIKLERFAVLPEFRRRGVAAAILQAVLQDVLPHRQLTYLHAQVSAMPLYAGAGFLPEGPLFYEANIPHYKMVYASDAAE